MSPPNVPSGGRRPSTFAGFELENGRAILIRPDAVDAIEELRDGLFELTLRGGQRFAVVGMEQNILDRLREPWK